MVPPTFKDLSHYEAAKFLINELLRNPSIPEIRSYPVEQLPAEGVWLSNFESKNAVALAYHIRDRRNKQRREYEDAYYGIDD